MSARRVPEIQKLDKVSIGMYSSFENPMFSPEDLSGP
jgi:hypothetical protein